MAKGFKTGGRDMGTQNKVTQEVKEAITMLLENNIPNLEKWLNRIAVNNPEKALGIYISLLEYSIPKLQRTEIKQNDMITRKSISDLFPTMEEILASNKKHLSNG